MGARRAGLHLQSEGRHQRRRPARCEGRRRHGCPWRSRRLAGARRRGHRLARRSRARRCGAGCGDRRRRRPAAASRRLSLRRPRDAAGAEAGTTSGRRNGAAPCLAPGRATGPTRTGLDSRRSNRRTSAPMATCASIRARWAPRQKCAPPPNARWSVSSRHVEAIGIREHGRVTVGEASMPSTRVPQDLAAELGIGVEDAVVRMIGPS